MNAIKKIVMGLAVACATVFCSAADIYVAKTGNDDTGDGTSGNPYATIATGIAAAKAAITAGGESATVCVSTGTYEEYGLVLDAAIEVVGTGATRDDVTIDAKSKGRAFTLSAAGAALRNLTVQNGKITSGSGANVNMTANGVISNCVIKDGMVFITKGLGGNVYMTSGLLTDCRLLGGLGNGSSAAWGYSIYATGGRISRCEIRDAVYEKQASMVVDLEGAAIFENSLICNCKTGSSGENGYVLRVNHANARVVNCTVVGNTSSKFGVRVNNAEAQVINTVIYNNGGTAEKEWGDYNATRFVNCAFGADAAYTGTSSTVKDLTKEDFVDYDGGDYTPAEGSALFNAGDNANYETYATSETDLAGQPRFIPYTIDIGAYEARSTEFTLLVEVSAGVIDPAAASSVIKGTVYAAPDTVTWEWKVDDGEFAAGGANYTLTGLADGVHTITAKVTSGGQTLEKTTIVRIASEGSPVTEAWVDVMSGDNVKGAGAAESPFATITYAKEFLDAHPAEGVQTIHVQSGVYLEHGFVLDRAIEIVGEGATREAVIIDANKQGRVFTLSADGAALRNLTVQNGKITSGSGANVNMTANGTISNCVIKDGTISVADGLGGNVYMTSGLLTDCRLLGGGGNGSSAAWGYSIYATGGRISRCEIRDAVYEKQASMVVDLEGAAIFENSLICNCKTGSSGQNGYVLRVNHAGARVVNCTVVGNTSSKFGVRVKNAGAQVINTVIYNNGGTAEKEWGDYNATRFVNCAFGADAAYTGTSSTVKDLTKEDFVDYDGGDYRPAEGKALIDAGNTDNYNSYATSAKDLVGNERIQNDAIDIGCYEIKDVPKRDMVVSVTSITTDYDGETHHATVTVTDPATGATVTWDDDSTGVNGPDYAAGFHTNAFTVTAKGYNDFVGQGFVEIMGAPVVATVTGATGSADGTAYSCTVTVTDPVSGWTAKWADADGNYTLDRAPEHKAKGVYTDSVKVEAEGFSDFIGQGVVEILDPPVGWTVIFN